MSAPFLAVDWGTTNRRVFRIEDGLVAHTERDARGATGITDFAAEVGDIRHRLGDLPMMLAGMVGSNLGWRTVPYVQAPVGLAELAAGLCWMDPRTAIVPGICHFGPFRSGDVMRGEEIQLLGAAAAGLVPSDGLLCQPGTHCKWARLTQGKITHFTTAMTGELFALLRNHSLLAGQLSGEIKACSAFRDGVLEGAMGDLAASLFSIRADALLALRVSRDAASFASGLLIGADVAHRLRQSPGTPVHILADPVLGELYGAAIGTLGGASCRIDSHAAFVAGITNLWERIQ
ncbi:2-dehydro-3-deoxygalactonokinase [Sphingopyxis sp. NJF-3]